jgi:ligand-binding sensor domain-containing protein
MTSGEIINYPVVESEGGFFDRRIVIYDLSVDGDVLWVANDLGVSKFLIYSNGGEIKDTAKKLGDLFDEQDVLSIAVIGDYVWAGTETGIAFTVKTNPNIQDPATWRSFGEFDFPQGRAGINTIAAYYDTVVVGVDSGLFKLEVFPDTNWVEMADFSDLRVNKILFHGGNLYASTHAGVRVFDGITWSSITNQGLTSGIGDIIFDDSDDLWGGTRGSGLAVLQDTAWALYSIPGPASNLITKMAIDSLGGLWMTHDARGLSRFFDGEWTLRREITMTCGSEPGEMECTDMMANPGITGLPIIVPCMACPTHITFGRPPMSRLTNTGICGYPHWMPIRDW